MAYKLNSQEKAQVLFTSGLVQLHYRQYCLKGDKAGNWRVGMFHSYGVPELLNSYKVNGDLMLDFNYIGFWKVYSKIIGENALKKLQEKGFVIDRIFNIEDNAGGMRDLYIFAFRCETIIPFDKTRNMH